MLTEIGSVVEGKVSGITDFGAFVQLQDGRTGLVHISEVADEYVKDVKQFLQEGQTVKVKVISVDNNGKVSLSIKKACEGGAKKTINPGAEWKQEAANATSFEDRLSKYLKDSDEKMQDIKKNFESKRGSGGYRKSAQY